MLLAHALLLVVLAGDYWITRDTRPHKKIVVKTVHYAPPPPQTKTIVAAAPPSPPTPTKKKEKAAPKTAPPKPTPAKVVATAPPAPKKKASPTKPIVKKEEATVLQKIEQNLETIAASEPLPLPKTEITIPTLNPIIYFPPEPTTVEEEVTDVDRITLLLQDLLQLPDYGEVKARLKIDRWGKLEDLEILDSKSAKNTEFLKKQLPEVQFPCLNETASLTIVFRNA